MTTNTLEQVSAEALQQAIDLFKLAGSEASRQLPDVASQYIRWCVIDAWIGIAGGIGLFFLILGLGFFFLKSSDEDDRPFVIFMTLLFFSIPTFVVADYSRDLVKAHTSPKVVLLEKAVEIYRETH